MVKSISVRVSDYTHQKLQRLVDRGEFHTKADFIRAAMETKFRELGYWNKKPMIQKIKPIYKRKIIEILKEQRKLKGITFSWLTTSQIMERFEKKCNRATLLHHLHKLVETGNIISKRETRRKYNPPFLWKIKG